jgi:N-acetylmuramoyl-L-alanine amidase
MRRLLALALLVAPAAAAAQSPARLTVQAAGVAAAYDAHTSHGAVRYGASALERLGAKFETEPHSLRIFLLGDTLVFHAGSPFFRDNARIRQLFDPVVERGDMLEIPAQFFTEWLPARFPEKLAYAAGTLRMRGAVPGATPPAPPLAGSPIAAMPPRTAPTSPDPLQPGNLPSLPLRRPKMQVEPVQLPYSPADTAHPAADARVVVLDAGHGGRDPGRTGPNGLREKDVTLQITQRLATLLRKRGYEVHLTRTRDTLISLADRPTFANKWKAGRPAALYVSVHANAGATAAKGFETYFLSDARTEDERRVAEMENAAVSYEEHSSGPDLSETDRILNGLRNDYYIKASDDLAEAVQKRLRTFHPGPNRGVKRAGFRVLVGAIMPAILVEAAFISNPREAKLLGTSAFQQKIAVALADAVGAFFTSHEHLWTVQAAQ